MPKPSLADLMNGVPAGPAVPPPVPGPSLPVVAVTAPPGGAAVRKRKPPTESEMRAQAWRFIVRSFARAYLTQGAETFMNATQSYLSVKTDCTNSETAKQEGWRMMQDPDVRAEMQRQLRAIDKAADLDDKWVYDRWRAMANANIFDYCSINRETGVVEWLDLDPQRLTPEQQMAIEEIRVDAKTGKITGLKLANKNQAVANVARARQMIDGKRDPGAVDMEKRITERMNRAAARVGRVIDNESGQVL